MRVTIGIVFFSVFLAGLVLLWIHILRKKELLPSQRLIIDLIDTILGEKITSPENREKI